MVFVKCERFNLVIQVSMRRTTDVSHKLNNNKQGTDGKSLVKGSTEGVVHLLQNYC